MFLINQLIEEFASPEPIGLYSVLYRILRSRVSRTEINIPERNSMRIAKNILVQIEALEPTAISFAVSIRLKIPLHVSLSPPLLTAPGKVLRHH